MKINTVVAISVITLLAGRASSSRDNMISNEDVVIRDTVDKFRKEIATR
jgi:hypothetical protein